MEVKEEIRQDCFPKNSRPLKFIISGVLNFLELWDNEFFLPKESLIYQTNSMNDTFEFSKRTMIYCHSPF